MLSSHQNSLLHFVACLGVGLASICTYRIYTILQELSEYNGISLDGKSLKLSTKAPRGDMHVVVGYYQGNNLPWVQDEDIPDEILNQNMFDPEPSAGKNGEAVFISQSDLPLSNKLFQINRFNLMASDRIPLNRSLRDVRRPECRTKIYELSELPTTSVIIVFHNEAWSTLLRTIHSVINRSPRIILAEIILVDDASQRLFLKDELDAYVANLPVPIKVIRSVERIGLIQARLFGAKEATGKVLTFLDAHCECAKGWLEPLLDRIKKTRQTIASPVIDMINDETFQYVPSTDLRNGGFNWDLHFRWFLLPINYHKEIGGDLTQPIKTPVMAGGLFSIDRNYFFELGGYDDQMKIWGGENIELSFRGWMCGASLEIVPCSHVGHVFRKSSPYTFPDGIGDTLNANLARVALVWMDEWKEFFFKVHPEIGIFAKTESVTERFDLRQNKLQCKSFKWYLDNIWPGHFMPQEDRFFGKVRNQKSQKCLQSPKTKMLGQPYGKASVSDCIIEFYASQLFVLTPEGYLKTDEMVCLDAPDYKKEESEVKIMACNTIERQKWIWEKETGRIKHKISEKCLDLPGKNNKAFGTGEVVLELRPCRDKSKSQKWALEEVKWK